MAAHTWFTRAHMLSFGERLPKLSLRSGHLLGGILTPTWGISCLGGRTTELTAKVQQVQAQGKGLPFTWHWTSELDPKLTMSIHVLPLAELFSKFKTCEVSVTVLGEEITITDVTMLRGPHDYYWPPDIPEYVPSERTVRQEQLTIISSDDYKHDATRFYEKLPGSGVICDLQIEIRVNHEHEMADVMAFFGMNMPSTTDYSVD